MDTKKYDVIIIGGSFAGLAAAMSLGRALKQVLIIDSEQPCNRQTPHSHNFITHDGETPAAIKAAAKKQVLLYSTVHYQTGVVTSVQGEYPNFAVHTADGNRHQALRIIFATGVKDIMPDIKGFAECWGISVIHCPFCHGYEYTGQATGILMNGDDAFGQARLISNWTSNLTIFTNGKSMLTEEQTVKLTAKNIRIVEDEISQLVHDKGYLKHILLAGGAIYPLAALYARPAFVQHCNIPAQLGCQLTDTGHLKTDELKRTTVQGVYAAGDNTTPMRSVALAVAAGTSAGAFIIHDIISENF